MVKIPALKELKGITKEELPNVGIKDHSRNTINTFLILIADIYGDEEANKVIEEFSLDESEDWINFLDKPEIKSIEKCIKENQSFIFKF